MNPSAQDWASLQGAIAGEVVLPGSPGYDDARKPAIARFHDVRPLAVVRCESAADVAETIALARRSELRTATRSGGHCFAGRSSTEGIVIDVSPLRSVSVSDGVATIGAGARLGDVYDALGEHGLTIPAGCGATVGIAGLTLGGGLGILGRKHGFTSDHLLAAQVVLAEGRVVECGEHRDEELFWALRGAGAGGLGVVTSLVFGTVPAPAATAFRLVWPHARAARVVEAWQGWAPSAPGELAASLLVTAAADADEPPVASVFGSMLGSEADTSELLDQLVSRAGAEPASAALQHGSFDETKRYLARLGDDDETAEGHLFSKSEFFVRPLPGDVVATLVEHLASGRVRGQSRELDFTPMGGAYNRVPADATALVHRDAEFLLKHAVEVDASGREPANDWLARSWASVRPWGSGGVYPNFPDPELEYPGRAYYGANHGRLLRVKAAYDPDAFFEFPQS